MPEAREVIRIGRRDVPLTRPNKVLFPEDGLTKRDLVDYYRRAAPWILPHLRGRPLSLERYPDGLGRPPIFQKSTPAYFPGWIRTVTVKKEGGSVRHVICEDAATLAYLANQACITPHIVLARRDRLEVPDQMVFDLDPSSPDFSLVKAAARSLREVLEKLGLPAYLKTSGSRGLHVAVPIRRELDFDAVRALARQIAQIVADQDPARRTLHIRKNQRQGRVFLDINRNGYAQTVAPAYAVRARRGAPVSTPLNWGELEKGDLRPDGVTVRTLFHRLESIEDPWENFWRDAVSLKPALRRIEERYAA